jgi:hypothetical protein
MRREEGKSAKGTRREEQRGREEIDPPVDLSVFSSSRFLRDLPFFAAHSAGTGWTFGPLVFRPQKHVKLVVG